MSEDQQMRITWRRLALCPCQNCQYKVLSHKDGCKDLKNQISNTVCVVFVEVGGGHPFHL